MVVGEDRGLWNSPTLSVVLFNMTDSQRKRDPRYTRTVGEKPDLGRRYVENGKVKIEWHEGEKRRSRTIGDNNAKTRREADEELERLLGLTDSEPENEEADEAMNDVDEEFEEELEEECFVVDISWLVEELRDRADALMDVADDLAESFERGMVRVLDLFRRSDDQEEDGVAGGEESDVEDADVVEEIDAEEQSDATGQH
jgi:hypothetical protein